LKTVLSLKIDLPERKGTSYISGIIIKYRMLAVCDLSIDNILLEEFLKHPLFSIKRDILE
jgi:hypothetical protein